MKEAAAVAASYSLPPQLTGSSNIWPAASCQYPVPGRLNLFSEDWRSAHPIRSLGSYHRPTNWGVSIRLLIRVAGASLGSSSRAGLEIIPSPTTLSLLTHKMMRHVESDCLHQGLRKKLQCTKRIHIPVSAYFFFSIQLLT